LIFGGQDELDEPGVIGKDGIAEPEGIILRVIRLRENWGKNTGLSE